MSSWIMKNDYITVSFEEPDPWCFLQRWLARVWRIHKNQSKYDKMSEEFSLSARPSSWRKQICEVISHSVPETKTLRTEEKRFIKPNAERFFRGEKACRKSGGLRGPPGFCRFKAEWWNWRASVSWSFRHDLLRMKLEACFCDSLNAVSLG